MIKAPEPTPEAKKVNKDGWIEQPKPVPKPKAPKAAQQPKQQPQKAVVNKFALLTVDDDGVPKKSKKGKKKKWILSKLLLCYIIKTNRLWNDIF